jgi:hypothetical protein
VANPYSPPCRFCHFLIGVLNKSVRHIVDELATMRGALAHMTKLAESQPLFPGRAILEGDLGLGDVIEIGVGLPLIVFIHRRGAGEFLHRERGEFSFGKFFSARSGREDKKQENEREPQLDAIADERVNDLRASHFRPPFTVSPSRGEMG